MQSGATAYVTKGADIQEMVRAIRKAHSGQRYISPEIAQKMALKQLGGSGMKTASCRCSSACLSAKCRLP